MACMKVGVGVRFGSLACQVRHKGKDAERLVNHLDEQSQHDAGLQEGKVLAQAVAGALNEWDKLHRACTMSEVSIDAGECRGGCDVGPSSTTILQSVLHR